MPRPYKEPLAKATWVSEERRHIYDNLKPEDLDELKGRVLAKRKVAKSVPAATNRVFENATREINSVNRQVIEMVKHIPDLILGSEAHRQPLSILFLVLLISHPAEKAHQHVHHSV